MSMRCFTRFQGLHQPDASLCRGGLKTSRFKSLLNPFCLLAVVAKTHSNPPLLCLQIYLCHHRALYQPTVVSSSILNRYVSRSSIPSDCILTNTLLTHVTYISSAYILINAIASPLYACHFNRQCLYSCQYPRIYAMRSSGENPQPGQPRQQLLDQGITPDG